MGAPVATSKPFERQDGSTNVQQRESADESAGNIDEDKLRRYAVEMVDELVDLNSYDEALDLLRERRSVVDKILATALNHVMEKGEKHRRMLGELVARWFTAMDGRGEDISKG